MATTVRIDDRVWRRITARVGVGGKLALHVGVLGDAELAEIFRHHEYGAPRANIPERSSLRSTLRERGRKDIGQFMHRAISQWMAGRIDTRKMFDLIGLYVANAVKQKIRTNIPPPLRPATIARKGSSMALIDTGRMINAIGWEVVD